MAKAKKKAAVTKKKTAKPAKKKQVVAKKSVKKTQTAKSKKAQKTTLKAKKTTQSSNKKVKAPSEKPSFKAALKKWGLHPLADRLVVEVQAGERMTAGGLYIPDTAEVSGHLRGKVLAAGQGGRSKKGQLRPLDVKVGDMVLFSQYVGSKMNVDGLEVQVLRESEVLGIVEE